jgi:hypothetical protein
MREYVRKNKAKIAAQRKARWAALSDEERAASINKVNAWARAHPEKIKPMHRRAHLRRMADMTLEQYDAMAAAQGGGCAICKGAPTGRWKRFFIDHDHSCCPGKTSCGKCVRGLICHHCNTGIGHLKDSADLCRAAAQYLEPKPTGLSFMFMAA